MSRSIVTADLVTFASQCEAAHALADLETIWRQRMHDLGFTFAAVGAHVDPLKPERATYVFQNYPEEWIAHFSEHHYHLVDPVFRAADAGAADFAWTDPEFLQPLSWRQRRILWDPLESTCRHASLSIL